MGTAYFDGEICPDSPVMNGIPIVELVLDKTLSKRGMQTKILKKRRPLPPLPIVATPREANRSNEVKLENLGREYFMKEDLNRGLFLMQG